MHINNDVTLYSLKPRLSSKWLITKRNNYHRTVNQLFVLKSLIDVNWKLNFEVD